MLLIYLCMLISTGSGAKLPGPQSYDLVWLASVQQHGPIGGASDNRDTLHTLPSFHDTDVQYKLFTRENPYDFQELKINDTAALKASNFHFEKKVKVLVHGWINSGSSPMPESVKEAYLNVSDLNIIVVDWEEAANVNYISASYNVAKVGHHLTQFLEFLVGQGVSTDDMHLIGHSLGAHVAGIAGAYVENATIDTITGLDPALPLFLGAAASQRLDRRDARHVEVIHSCGGYLGFHSPLGHVDFYPNGELGSRAVGQILELAMSEITRYSQHAQLLNLWGDTYYNIIFLEGRHRAQVWKRQGFCAHNRAHIFFSESIISEVPFTAVRCWDYIELFWYRYCRGTGERLIMGGFDIHYGREGIYYLQTRAEPPYALGEDWIEQANNAGG